jgi:membrane-associated phospholipid phosphatase
LTAAALCLVPVGISWSRLYLGVHWFTAVVAGALVACFWVACCLLARQFALGRLPGRETPPPATGLVPHREWTMGD